VPPHLVAVEQLDPVALLLQVRDHDVRDGALAGTDRPVNQRQKPVVIARRLREALRR
jgi:hypothetical protein